jgi:hypothetical protein
MKLLITVITLAITSTAGVHAKMYYFTGFAADFPKQPKVIVRYNPDGTLGCTDYKVVFPNYVFGVATAPQYGHSLEELLAYYTGIAQGEHDSPEIKHITFMGYPAVAVRGVTKRGGYTIRLEIITNGTTYALVVYSVTKQQSENIFRDLVESFTLTPVEIRPAIPVPRDARSI